MKLLLRLFSFIFHLPLALFLFALGVFGVLDSAWRMSIDFLPWSGKTLVYALLGIGLLGLVSIYMAARGKMKFIFALYSLLAFVLIVNAVFFSTHRYPDVASFRWAVGFAAGGFGAFMGALVHLRG